MPLSILPLLNKSWTLSLSVLTSRSFQSLFICLRSSPLPPHNCRAPGDDMSGRWPWPWAWNIHMTWESALMKHQTDVFINSLPLQWHTVGLTRRDRGDFEETVTDVPSVCVCVSLLAQWWSDWQLVFYPMLRGAKGDSSLISTFIRELIGRCVCVCMWETT